MNGSTGMTETRRRTKRPCTTGASSNPKLSINVPEEIGLRLKRMAFEHDVSESSIIEIALTEFLQREPRRGWGMALREKGASLAPQAGVLKWRIFENLPLWMYGIVSPRRGNH